MIQLNLLPDVKLEYIKARRTKRLVILISTIVAGASVALMAMLFIATSVLQRQHLNNLTEDIDRDSQTLREEDGLNRILTVQNQLNTLDELHSQKPATGRLGGFLGRVTPKDVSLSKLEVDFETNSMVIEGGAPTLRAVNQFIDTLKFTTFSSDDQNGSAFSNVILSNFERADRGQDSEQDPVTYQITLNFDPVIFENEIDVKLEVRDTVTTQSADRIDPNTIFQDNSNGNGE